MAAQLFDPELDSIYLRLLDPGEPEVVTSPGHDDQLAGAHGEEHKDLLLLPGYQLFVICCIIV